MICFHPIKAYRTINGDVIFHNRHNNIVETLQVPCGQCIGCRLKRSHDWAIRIMHEAKLHETNYFLTLTYDDEHLPSSKSLIKKDFQDFMKRLRKVVGKVRYFHCGEYGDLNGRPHYHAIMFGLSLSDVKFFTIRNSEPVYTSDTIASAWGMGLHELGSVTFESAAYVARYSLKKVNGKNADLHYLRYAPDGQPYHIQPEYCTMSRRPGIGSAWFDKYQDDVVSVGGVVKGDIVLSPPRFYDKKLEFVNPVALEQLKFERYKKSILHVDDNTKERLAVREKVTQLSCEQLKRSL